MTCFHSNHTCLYNLVYYEHIFFYLVFKCINCIRNCYNFHGTMSRRSWSHNLNLLC